MALPTDILLDENGDLKIVNGDFFIVRGADQVRQSWLIHIRTFLGELLLDTSKGVPYIQKLFVKRITRERVKSIFTDETLKVEGVLRVNGVIVSDLDAVTRKIDVLVDCQIEGEEHATFRFNEVLAPDAGFLGDPDFPLRIGSPVVWFDASDLASLVYVPSSMLVLQNKAGTGSAAAAASSGFPVLVGVSPLNNKRAIWLNNPNTAGSNGQHLEFFDTPAIRHGGGSITCFAVGRWVTKVSGDTRGGMIGLLGWDDVFNELAYYANDIDANLSGNPAMIFVGGAPEEDLSDDDAIIPTTFTDPHVFAWRLDHTGLTGDVDLWSDTTKLTPAGNDVDARKLNGDGYLGASVRAITADEPALFFNGYLGEVLVYDGVLVDSDVDKIIAFLRSKWGF